MKKYLPFVVLWVTNSILLYLAAFVFPFYFVLGTYRLSTFWAAVVAGFVWTLLTWVAAPILAKFKIRITGRVLKFGFYFLANFVALWITARLAPYTGFGTTKFMWIAGLAIIADALQYAVWKLGKF